MNSASLWLAIMLALTVSASAQAPRRLPGTPLTASELVDVIGTEPEARTVLSEALRYALRIDQNLSTVTLLASQFREGWIPAVPDTRFVRISDDDALALIEMCGSYVSVRAASMGNGLSITVGRFGKCTADGLTLQFRRQPGGRWQRVDAGTGGLFGGGINHCACS